MMKMMMIYKFYDTSSLLILKDRLIDRLEDDNEEVIISSITLQELDKIKQSNSKSEEVKAAARKVSQILTNHIEKYHISMFENRMLWDFYLNGFEASPDIEILATAVDYEKKFQPDNMIFVTNDLLLKVIANLFFGEDSIESIEEDTIKDDYTGYQEIQMDDREMSHMYLHTDENPWNLLPNEYLIVQNAAGESVDCYCWTGEKLRQVPYKTIESTYFGKLKPMKNDIYQQIYIDSLINNQVTLVHGKPGSGKTTIALAYLMQQMEKGHIDRIVIFCNTVATRGSAKLGFYPGSKDDKLIDSQIGNLLTSKLGDKFMVEEMIENGKIVLMPMSDIRGYDTSGLNAGVYISEAQNMDINLMKLALQRIGEDSICIIDGDFDAQVDLNDFAGSNNGMKRASKIFRGHDIYGQVCLKNIHRSKIAEIADLM